MSHGCRRKEGRCGKSLVARSLSVWSRIHLRMEGTPKVLMERTSLNMARRGNRAMEY